jgi:hypothetical protein
LGNSGFRTTTAEHALFLFVEGSSLEQKISCRCVAGWQRRCVQFGPIFVLVLLLCETPESLGQYAYPHFVPPRISLEHNGADLLVTASAGADVPCEIYASPSLRGPWEIVATGGSWLVSPFADHTFIRAASSTNGFRRPNGEAASFSFIAVRFEDGGFHPFVTPSGFVLEPLQEWVSGSWVYQITDGPGTDNPVQDFEKLHRELLDDPSTTAVFTPLGPYGHCFGGIADLFMIQPGPEYTPQTLVDHNLVELKQVGGYHVVRWLAPKSMEITDFLKSLAPTPAISFASWDGIGCAD